MPDITSAQPGASEQPRHVPTDHRGTAVLPLETCLERLREKAVGRVGFVHDGEVVILPVNHVVEGTQIMFRTTWGAKLQAAADDARVAFEVDQYDVQTHSGWSVLVQGTAEVIYDESETRRLTALAPAPWIPVDDGPFWVRIAPVEISGRQIVAGPA